MPNFMPPTVKFLRILLCTAILVHKRLELLFMKLNAEHW